MTLLPIGRFARASRLSVKSLRNYAESGLLPASFVDPQSGYRYYRLEQLARADAIRTLRMVDMPLARIAETLDGDDPESMLRDHLASLQQQRDELDRQVQHLQRHIDQKDFIMSTDVTIKAVPALTAVARRTATTHLTVFDDIPAGFAAVASFLTEAEVDPAGVPFTVFHQAPDGDTPGDIALCIPVAAAVETPADLVAVDFAEGVAASIVHEGPYDNMGRTYAAMAAWIQERGHRIVGPTREIYLNHPAEVAEAELRTELLFPIDAEEQA